MVLLVALAVGAVALAVQTRPWDPIREVRGVLIEVRASEISRAEAVTLRDDEGRTWIFRVAEEVATNREEPQSASHLRQHMAFAEPMRVRYRVAGGELIALRILDAG